MTVWLLSVTHAIFTHPCVLLIPWIAPRHTERCVCLCAVGTVCPLSPGWNPLQSISTATQPAPRTLCCDSVGHYLRPALSRTCQTSSHHTLTTPLMQPDRGKRQVITKRSFVSFQKEDTSSKSSIHKNNKQATLHFKSLESIIKSILLIKINVEIILMC